MSSTVSMGVVVIKIKIQQMLRHDNKCRQMSSNDVNFNDHNSTLFKCAIKTLIK